MEHFSILLEGIHRQERVCNSVAVATTLSTAKSTLEKLNQLVQVKLLKNMHGTSRARKRAWARNKSKVYKMQNELKELRASLTAAMGASTLSVYCCYFGFIDADNPPRSSAIRAETTLNSMNDCLSNTEQTSLSLDRHLLSIQQIVTQTYDAVSAQNVAMNRLLQSNISDLNCYRNLNEHQSSWPLWHSREPQYVISRPCSDHSKEHMVTARKLINPTEDQEDGRERKPAIKSSVDSYLHSPRRNTCTGALESLRSLTKCFSRIIYYISATASMFSHRSQLLRVDLFCRLQNQLLQCFLSEITKTMVQAEHNYSNS